MSELSEKVKTSIERLKAFEPRNGEGYYLAFSGGKDSVVCKALMDMAGVKYDATYRVTSVDPPELVRFIMEKHPDVKREIPHDKDGKPITMWKLIQKFCYPPMRIVRYCCRELKEDGGDGRKTVTGVRWDESVNRTKNQGLITVMGKKASEEFTDSTDFSSTKRGGVVLVNDNEESRQMVEQCYKRHKTTVNPIIDWTYRDVWDFIREEGISYCSLYDEGFHRLGCIGCPMATTRERERQFKRWPKYKEAYLRAFDKMLEERKRRNNPWKNPENATSKDIFNMWMEYDILPGQMDLFEEEDDG